MDYTSSPDFAIHPGTGNRMHQDTAAVTTGVSADDMNKVVWSMMEVVKDGGLAGVPFDKNNPDTYRRFIESLKRVCGGMYGENVLKHGAKLDGVTDDTAAINLASATGRPVFIPFTNAGCVVNNAAVLDGMTVFGERLGSHGGTMLIVTQAGAAAFKHTAATERYNLSFRDFSCKSSNNANATNFYGQTDKAHYTAYATFENIDTWGSLTLSYDGYFIFTDWINCRDGYLGTVGATHNFISSQPVAYGQANATNICTVQRCKVFNAIGGSAAIDVAYGALWSFRDTDFENLAVRSFRGRAMQNVSFDWCWFEGQSAGTPVAEMVLVDIYPATAAGTYPVTFRNCWGVIPNVTGQFVNIASALCQVNAENVEFNLVAAGVKFSNDGTRVGYLRNVQAISGAGAAGFFAGHFGDTYSGGKRLLAGASDSGSGALVQSAGINQASGGFLSGYFLPVSTVAVQLGVPNLIGGMAFINGYNASGGAQGWWLVAWHASGVATTIASQNNTGLTVAFTVSGGALKMATTAGTLNINVSLLV